MVIGLEEVGLSGLAGGGGSQKYGRLVLQLLSFSLSEIPSNIVLFLDLPIYSLEHFRAIISPISYIELTS